MPTSEGFLLRTMSLGLYRITHLAKVVPALGILFIPPNSKVYHDLGMFPQEFCHGTI